MCIVISAVGCGTTQPTPSPTITPTASLMADIITPAVTIAPSPTTIATSAPISTPYERRPLPPTWTPTLTATITLTFTPSATPPITPTPTATATRTTAELCEDFNPVIIYDDTIAYPRETILTVFAGIDDPTYLIIFEMIEQVTGETFTNSFSTNGFYTIGELILINFPIIGTYDWTFYLESPDGERFCPVSGVISLRETTLFDLIQT
ncbi:MAG TPA: hypothetical protein PLZ51_15135, partial [Aggregatilineales bacterium]|nr:hypothetical protein [Aggregatilineales bacterium]